ncbi:ABC transporter ATP-binding protein [Leptospira sp. GIMC2001]|uniref:ABC transporter ATP-binding protein n=1 Tax=Leptospira sp. GIMC2001 TaxID=1513297 RepID=UPI00234AA0E9|nr:ABC transporter ATP-binding protein [Leptospira sp. GIMC2001]WCL50035.1 ABC transporter ATP-binding protein [Leptospira sp. GIMC2001]
MIQVSNLSKSYGEKKAIQNLNFTLEKGEVVGLLGLNGAGKTTTLRILTGYIIPSSGDARIDGKSIFDEPLEAKKKIGYLPESPPIYEELTVRDYLTFVARIKGIPPEEITLEINNVMDKTGISKVANSIIGHLSLGYRKRVGISQALLGNPSVIVMDEPISGLDPQQIIEIRNLIRSLAGEHTVLISSHILTEIYKTCDKFLFLQDGRLRLTYTLDELEAEMEKISGLEITLSGKSQNEIENYLSSTIGSSGKLKFIEQDRNGYCFLVNVDDEKKFKENVFETIKGNNLSMEYLKKQDVSLEEIFMNRFQEKK